MLKRKGFSLVSRTVTIDESFFPRKFKPFNAGVVSKLQPATLYIFLTPSQMNFRINTRLPTVIEYNELRRLAQWPEFDANLVKQGLANTLCSVVAEDDEGRAVGMGRVVGDNAIYFHIQDVIVRPEFQRQGVGKLIMTELLKYVEINGGRNTNVGLMCSKGREPFYQEFGFIERPNDRFGSGMIMIME